MKNIPNLKMNVTRKSTMIKLLAIVITGFAYQAYANTADAQQIGQAKCIWWNNSNFTGTSTQMVTSDSAYSSVGDVYSIRVRMRNNEGENKQAEMTLFDPGGADDILTTEAVTGGDEIEQDASIAGVTNNISCKVF